MGQAESYEGNINCPVNRYRYSPLPQGCIRLLRLLPSEKSDSRLQGHLFNYPLGLLAAKTHLYEALSYVWGDLNNSRLISLGNYDFPVTKNLHTALLYLRDQYIERIIWVDALCINQEDLNEKGEQVRRMAEIYSKASRVIVWLGHMENHSNEALETIRIAAQRPHGVDDKLTREAVFCLLRRPWFERIWVLQEVASARQILIKGGDTEMDGHVFCTGLTSKSFEYLYKDFPDLHTVVRPVIFLMSESLFRPKVVERTSNEFSLNIRPLGELLDMYHTRKATKQHDKLFALIGMSSDASIPTDLLPDYSTPWARLFERLIRYLLGGDVAIRTCDASERVLISGSGYILGKVLSVTSSQHEDGQDVGLATRDIDGSFGPETQWRLPAIAKPVQVGDLICQLRGAAKPTIIRLCHDHFSIILIAPSLELKQPVSDTSLVFFLSWDWQDAHGKLSNLDDAQRPVDYSLPWHWGNQCAACSSELHELWCTGLILDEAEEYRLAENKLQQVLSGYEETIGAEDPRTLVCMDKLALIHKKLGLLNDEEPNMVPEELRGLRLSELSSLNDWTLRLKFKQKGVIRYGTAFRINIPGVERAVLLTARRNLADEQGRLSQDLEIYNEHGRNKLRDIGHKEVFLSAFDPRSASDTGVYSGYGAILFDKEAESYLGGYGFSLELGQANLEGDGLGVCGYLKQDTLSRSTGLCLSCQDDRMTYNAITMPGMSGSPVFMSRNGDATAVGIQ
ncbi:hypothetical protein AFLA70_197g002161 [Aspergillus flavus AF70]|nr:hypothetical protein AFLA70_197g002161 [Aspergillus flavus AF70]